MHLHKKKTVRWAASTYTAECTLDGWHFKAEGHVVVLARRTDETLSSPENVDCGNVRMTATGGSIRSSLSTAMIELSRERVRGLKLQHHCSLFDSSRGNVRKPRLQHPRGDIQNPLRHGDSANGPLAPWSRCNQNPLQNASRFLLATGHLADSKQISSSDISRDRVHTPKLQHRRADGRINPLWQGDGTDAHLAPWRYSNLNGGKSQHPLRNSIKILAESVDIDMEDAPMIVSATKKGMEPETNNIEPVEVRPRLNITHPTPSGDEKTDIVSLIDMMSSLAI